MISLGFNLGHDQGAALVIDGEIACAISEERISRIKHHSNVVIPLPSIEYCFDVAGVGWSDLDAVVFNYPHHTAAYDKVETVETGVEALWGKRPFFIPHHLSHAYAALYASSFDHANILVADGAGNIVQGRMEEFYRNEGWPVELIPDAIESESIFTYRDGAFTPTFSRYQTRVGENQKLSLGRMYWEACLHLGMHRLDAGKLMGLAPYGRTDAAIPRLNATSVDFDLPVEFIHNLPQGDFDQNAYTAKIIQSNLEDLLLLLVRHSYETSPSPNLCMSGGIALNAITNRRILNETPYEELFIVPSCNDMGIPLGCAYYGYYNLLQGAKRKPYVDYTGKEYQEQEILKALEGHDYVRCDDITREVAQRLSEGQVVGWFQGRSEYGPRALGNRSILCDPRKASNKDKINAKVKHREAFRPFAPSVLHEYADTYFHMPCPDSPHMLLILHTREEQKDNLRAVVHVDGTSRIQTVKQKSNPLYYELIKAFGDITGVYAVLNTSYNVAGEPIVETPEDAIRCFLGTEIDSLAVGDYIVSK